MEATDVLKIYTLLLNNDIDIWVDGGWCVDALLGKQTRHHPDLDIAVDRKNNSKLRKILEKQGFQEQKRNDSTDWMYLLNDQNGHEIDIHVFEYDDNGKNIYGIEYPYSSLTGKGVINNQEIRCIDPKWMFKFKTSYEPKEKDIKDVRGLSKKFGFKLPRKYT